MWGQSKDLEKIYGFHGKMCGIHVKRYGKVWNPCGKCMESMEKGMESMWKSVESMWKGVESMWNPCRKCMESMWKSVESMWKMYGIHGKKVWNKYKIGIYSIWIPLECGGTVKTSSLATNKCDVSCCFSFPHFNKHFCMASTSIDALLN